MTLASVIQYIIPCCAMKLTAVVQGSTNCFGLNGNISVIESEGIVFSMPILILKKGAQIIFDGHPDLLQFWVRYVPPNLLGLTKSGKICIMYCRFLRLNEET